MLRAGHFAKYADTGSLRGDLIATLAGMRDMMSGPPGQLMTGLVAALQKDADLARVVRTTMVEDKREVTKRLLDRAIARGELPADTDRRVFPEIAPGIMFMRVFLSGEPVDEEFLVHLTDDILIPLMTRSAGG